MFFLVSLARAEEPVITVNVIAPVKTDESAYGQDVRDPQYGGNVVIGSNCNVSVKANGLPAAKLALLITAAQKAKAECLTASTERASGAQRDAAAATLTTAVATVVSAAATPAANGGSVSLSLKDGDVSLDTGRAAEIRASYRAYGQVLGGGGIVNPRDWLLTQSRMGLSGPQVQAPVAQPAASTSDEVAELRRALEAKNKLIEELSGS